MKIFLDDIREPYEAASWMHQRIGTLNPIYLEEWTIVRNGSQFITIVSNFINDITHVSFDHDLGEDEATQLRLSGISKRQARIHKKTVMSGYDCACWMKAFYLGKGIDLPLIFIHSQSNVGTENIMFEFNKREQLIHFPKKYYK